MPRFRRRRKRKSKFVTRRALPFLLMKTAEAHRKTLSIIDNVIANSIDIEFDMSVISQGDGVAQRNGNEIQATGFVGKFTFSIDPSIPETRPSYARVILWMPRGDNQVVAPDAAPTEFPDPERYIIWADRTVALPWTNSLTGSMITIKKKFKPYMLITYDGSSDTSATKGKLQVNVTTDSSSGGALCTADLRLFFRDV